MKEVMRESIQKRTMRRVIAVYYLKKVINMVTLKIGILTLTALAFGSLVHVAAVFNNMPQLTDVGALLQFSLAAFFNTGVVVQGIVLALGATTLWLMRDVFKLIHIPNMKPSYA